MRRIFPFLAAVSVLLLTAASGKVRTRSNGETIYNTGKNLAGEKLLDSDASRIKIAKSCRSCHGPGGDAMRGVSIRYSDLSDPRRHEIPYNDSLLFRFLDDDLLSNGEKADIGVIWKMSDEDKRDLIAYLKTL
jgi:cytochrome c553